METTKVGFRFDPTDEELINYFLKNKINGKTWLVHDTIREVKISNYDPTSLPALSMIKSKDNVWYFIAPKEYTSPKKVSRKRTTPSGFWKPTGNDRKVKLGKRRGGAVIGVKRSLIYHQGNSLNAVWTPWALHEYERTSMPFVAQNYVLCKIFYKGNAGEIPSGSSNSTEPSHSLATEVLNPADSEAPLVEQAAAGDESLSYFSVNDVTMIMNEQENVCPWDALCPAPNPNVQQPQDDDEFLGALAHVNREHVEFLFADDPEVITHENMFKWLY